MKWVFHGDAPIYAQLIEQLKAGIVSGQLAPGEKLPPVRDLAAEAGVNPNTMQRALMELEREGLLYAHRTVGRFVTEDSSVINSAREELAQRYIRGFFQSMEGLGYPHETITALLNREKQKEEAANGNSGM